MILTITFEKSNKENNTNITYGKNTIKIENTPKMIEAYEKILIDGLKKLSKKKHNVKEKA